LGAVTLVAGDKPALFWALLMSPIGAAAILVITRWLNVHDRNKRGLAFRAIVAAVLLPTLYVASFGPACWLSNCNWDWFPSQGVPRVYRPLRLATQPAPSFARRPLRSYAEYLARPMYHGSLKGMRWTRRDGIVERLEAQGRDP